MPVDPAGPWKLQQVFTLSEKWTGQHNTNVEQRKRSEFPTGIKPMAPEYRASALSSELGELLESKFIWETGVLHTARMSTVEVIASAISE